MSSYIEYQINNKHFFWYKYVPNVAWDILRLQKKSVCCLSEIQMQLCVYLLSLASLHSEPSGIDLKNNGKSSKSFKLGVT